VRAAAPPVVPAPAAIEARIDLGLPVGPASSKAEEAKRNAGCEQENQHVSPPRHR